MNYNKVFYWQIQSSYFTLISTGEEFILELYDINSYNNINDCLIHNYDNHLYKDVENIPSIKCITSELVNYEPYDLLEQTNSESLIRSNTNPKDIFLIDNEDIIDSPYNDNLDFIDNL